MRFQSALCLGIISVSFFMGGQIVPANTEYTPEFKRLNKKHWLRIEKAEAKSFKKGVKKRAPIVCAPVDTFRSPPEPFYLKRPYFPVLAEQGGECTVRFNINRKGLATDIDADCSNERYRGSAEQTVFAWWFKSLRDSDASDEAFCGYEVKFKFQLE